jgi:MFS family permease
MGYTYSTYSSALKRQFGLDQADTDTINTVGYAIGVLSFIPGRLSDLKGPRLAVLTGGIVQSVAFGFYWAVCTKAIATQYPVTMLATLSSIAMLGSSAITATVYATATRTFPHQRGTVVGIVKASVGLCSGIVSQLYVGFVHKPDDSPATLNIILVQLAMILAVTTLPFQFLPGPSRPTAGTKQQHSVVPYEDDPDSFRTRLNVGYFTVASLVGLLSVAALAEPTASHDTMRGLSIAVCVCWALPLTIPMQFWNRGAHLPPPRLRIAESSSEAAPMAPLLEFSAGDSAVADGGNGDGASGADDGGTGPKRSTDLELEPTPQVHPARIFALADFWLLALAAMCNIGAGVMVTMNSGQMADAAALPGCTPAALVDLFSVAQTAGRVLAGTASDRMLLGPQRPSPSPSQSQSQSKHAPPPPPRPWALCAASAAAGAGHALLAYGGSPTSMLGGVGLVGLGFGMTWPLLVVLASELFGTTHLGTNYMFFNGICGGGGTLVFAKAIPQAVYQAHCAAGSSTCSGAECFRAAHLSTAGALALAAAAAAALAVRTRPLYAIVCRNLEKAAACAAQSR